MNHVMLDIETLGQGSNSVITSIAAVQFDINTGETKDSFYKSIEIDSAVKAGLHIESDTVLWWMGQTDKARENFLELQEQSQEIEIVLRSFSKWFAQLTDKHDELIPLEKKYIWGRGPRFDMGILTDAYKAFDKHIPWNFRNERCVRTVEFFQPWIKENTEIIWHEDNKMHDALKDCIFQIAYVSNTYHTLTTVFENHVATLFDRTKVKKLSKWEEQLLNKQKAKSNE